MPPTAQDPNLKPLPNFIGPGYQAIRELIIALAPNTTPEQAAEQIQVAYNADRQARIQAWDDQWSRPRCPELVAGSGEHVVLVLVLSNDVQQVSRLGHVIVGQVTLLHVPTSKMVTSLSPRTK